MLARDDMADYLLDHYGTCDRGGDCYHGKDGQGRYNGCLRTVWARAQLPTLAPSRRGYSKWSNRHCRAEEEGVSERKSVIEKVVYQEKYDQGPFDFGASYKDGSLDAVIQSLVRIRDRIPEQYRDKATCEIESTPGYEDSHYATIEVAYTRPETDAEMFTRLENARIRAMATEQKERETLAALKRKFGEA